MNPIRSRRAELDARLREAEQRLYDARQSWREACAELMRECPHADAGKVSDGDFGGEWIVCVCGDCGKVVDR